MDRENNIERIIEIIGTRAFNNLVKEMGGQQIYIPSRVSREKIYNNILKDFDSGYNMYELARKYKYSVAHIRRIIRD